MNSNGISIALVTYAIAFVISMLTAAIISFMVKIIELYNRSSHKKKI